MKIAVVDESAARASIIEEGLAGIDDREVFIRGYPAILRRHADAIERASG